MILIRWNRDPLNSTVAGVTEARTAVQGSEVRASRAISASWEGISPARPRTAWHGKASDDAMRYVYMLDGMYLIVFILNLYMKWYMILFLQFTKLLKKSPYLKIIVTMM